MILRSSITILNRSLNNLRTQIQSNDDHLIVLEYVSRKLTLYDYTVKGSIQRLYSNNANEKLFKYTSNVISLYGALEHFVEGLIEEYVEKLNVFVSSSSNLPQNVINKYLDRCIEIIKKAESPGKLKDLKKLKILESAHLTLNSKKCQLIPESFISVGGGNYKHSEICKCFSALGVSNIDTQLKLESSLCDYFSKFFGDDYKSKDSSTLYKLLDELVDRRNDLAHGGNNFSIIKDVDFIQYIDMVECYANAMCSYLRKNLAEYHWNSISVKEIIPDRIDDNCVEFSLSSMQIKKGIWFLFCTGGSNPQYGYCKIENIRIDDTYYEEFNVVDNTKLCCKMNVTLKKNYSFKNAC